MKYVEMCSFVYQKGSNPENVLESLKQNKKQLYEFLNFCSNFLEKNPFLK